MIIRYMMILYMITPYMIILDMIILYIVVFCGLNNFQHEYYLNLNLKITILI